MKIILIPTEPPEIEAFKQFHANQRQGKIIAADRAPNDLSITVERSAVGCLLAMPADESQGPQKHQWGSTVDALCNLAAYQVELGIQLQQSMANRIFSARQQAMADARVNQSIAREVLGKKNGPGSV